MTWQELLNWVNTRSTTRKELKSCASALGLNTTGRKSDLRTRIASHANAQTNDLNDTSTWTPANMPTATSDHSWLKTVGILALMALTGFGVWMYKDNKSSASPSVTTATVTATTPTTTVTPDPTVTPATTTMAPATTVTTATTTMVTTATANTVAMKPTPSFSSTETHGSWTINATERLAENPIVMAWMDRLRDPAPEMWKTFPNVPNTDVPEFRVVDGTQVPDGMEYGTYDSPYCYTDPCDFIVGAWEYRYYSGPYNFEGFECGMVGSDQGCLLLVINVMDQSYTFRDNSFDNGFTLRGRYFNGDALEWGVWGLVSHGSANMLNMPTMAHPDEVLNSGDPGNSGANCGTPQGCNSVNVRVLVYAGDTLVSDLETTVTK